MKQGYVPNTWKDGKSHYIKALDEPWYKLLVKLENLLSVETMKFYQKRNILTIHLPITTGSISSPMVRGSDSLPVKVKLEGVDTYLADSMQFLLEYGCRLTDRGVYYIMPSFRGEKGNFPRITFNEAEAKLKELHNNNIEKYIEYNDGWRNITREGEKEIMNLYNGIVWVTNYDILAVPFYQKFDKKNKGTTKNADLLMGIGETVGCGERHENYEELLESLKYHEVDTQEYEWYLNMKKIKPLKTSGFGMGTERFFMWVLKCDDIRNMQICLRFNGENILP